MIWDFVRHGQTDYNVRRLFQGSLDIPLNETGRRQAAEAGERMRAEGISFVRVYSSPMGRALETAELISGLNRDLFVVDDRLTEMVFGIWEGQSFDADLPEIRAYFDDPAAFRAHDGIESYAEILSRTGSFLADLKKTAVPGSEHILIQTHGAALRALISNLDALPMERFWETRVENCERISYRIDAPGDTPTRI